MDIVEMEFIEKLNKILNKFLLKSRQFCNRYCFPDGLSNILKFSLITDKIPNDVLYNASLSYDFDYFIFTKSTKTLHAIKKLLSDQNYYFNEDILILTRSIFEGHLASRYCREHIDDLENRNDVIKEFIRSPIGLITDYYFQDRQLVKDKDGSLVSKINGPSKIKEGEDIGYYKSYYPFLCLFTHNSFGTIKFYFEGSYFRYDKNNFQLESLLFVIFTFSKLFEGIVTVIGEDLGTMKEEKSFYDLVYESIELQQDIFKYLISKYEKVSADNIDEIIQLYLCEGNPNGRVHKIKDMLIRMNKSLSEEIGSLNKSNIDKDGRFIRQYPIYE